jgi:hypothetical protein
MEQCTFSWTALPPLSMRGLGTELVEPLDYYALRMSWTTGWSTRQLSALLDAEDSGSWLRPSYYLFGERREAQISALERLTGNSDLRYGTLWVLKDVLNTKGLYCHGGATRRWCPACYKYWDQETSWEPLVWSIPYVSRCPVHQCDLVEECSSCGAKQRRDAPIDLRHHCQSCGASLAGDGAAIVRPKFYDWVDREICRLVAFCSTSGREPIAADTLSYIAKGLESYAMNRHELQRARRCLALQRGSSIDSRLSLTGFINLSALLGTTLVDVLTRPQEAMSSPLLDLWSGFHWLCDPFAKKDDTVRVARWLVRKVLRTCRAWYLPSMRVLVKDLGVSPSRLKEFDPEIYETYMDAYTKQTSPSVRYSRGIAFAVARGHFQGSHPNSWNHHKMWKLPREVEKQAPGSFEDAYRASCAALFYSRYLAKATSHTRGAMAVKDDDCWIEWAPTNTCS